MGRGARALSFLRVRERPAWHARLHRRLLGGLLAAKAIEGVVLGRGAVFAGDAFAPSGHLPPPGMVVYGLVVLTQLAAGAGLLAERAPRALLIAGALATSVDTLVAVQNNRIFLSLLVWLVALGPAPDAGRRRYWHLDATGWQLAIVYVSAALHKVRPDYLSGETLTHLPHMPHAILGVVAPFGVPWVAQLGAWLVVAAELGLPLLLFARSRRLKLAGLTLACGLHLAMAATLPDAWSFSLSSMVALIAFLPTTENDEPRPALE